MRVESISGVRVAGISACLPARKVDPIVRLTGLCGDAGRASSVVAATGISTLRIAEPGVAPVDLCCAAAERLLVRGAVDRARIGAIVFVSFTSPETMPCAAAQAQVRLGLGDDVQAFDVGLACSGYVYGLYLASLLARQSGRAVLLLDGDVQSRVLKPDDESTAPILADAGTATLVEPDASAPAMRFAFLTRGAEGAALTCPSNGPIKMDGLAVFKFVANDISRFLEDFIASTGVCPPNSGVCPPPNSGVCPPPNSGVCPQNSGVCPPVFDAFVPHQANVYLVKRLAKTIGIPLEKLWISADRFGNSASATIPVTLAHVGRLTAPNADDSPGHYPGSRRILLAGFGGGLSAAACDLTLSSHAALDVFDFE